MQMAMVLVQETALTLLINFIHTLQPLLSGFIAELPYFNNLLYLSISNV